MMNLKYIVLIYSLRLSIIIYNAWIADKKNYTKKSDLEVISHPLRLLCYISNLSRVSVTITTSVSR